MNNAPVNTDDTIDSRDVIERIEELEGERSALSDTLDEAQEALDAFDPEEGGGDEAELQQAVADATRDLTAWDTSSEAEELKALSELASEAEGYADDWRHGAQLIRDSYFKDYAQELANDCGMVNSDVSWPMNCIDWDEAARQLKQDYTSVDFDSVTYWVR